MTSVSGIGYNSYNPYFLQQNSIQQSLFKEIDTSGSGSITKPQLEQAVTAAGGTNAAADALYADLDPNNTGSSQNLPMPLYSSQMGAQMIGYQAQGWPGAPGGGGSSQVAQSLFAQIDSDGSGSITKSELEQAVTNAGGTAAAADALYAKLDPQNTGSVSEQQFVSALSSKGAHHHGHHHHAGGGGEAGDASAQEALAALFQQDAGSNADATATSTSQLAQDLFAQIDTSGSGSITKTDLEQAVTAAGGTSAAADALYVQLDPNNTGSVSEQQFAQFLQPPSPTGTTAQDAILALLDPVSQSASATSAGGNAASTAVSAVSGTTAQDAVLALLNNMGSGSAGTSTSGNTAQDALRALLQADPVTASSAGAGQNLAAAMALYQSQLDQQMLSPMVGPGSAGV